MEDTKLLVSGAASTPDKLAQAAQSSAATITQLAEVVKLGAASLGSDDPETQVWVAWWRGMGPARFPQALCTRPRKKPRQIGTFELNNMCTCLWFGHW